MQSIQSKLVLFCPLQFYSVHSVTLVLICPFILIQSTLVHLGPIQSIHSYSVHIGPLQSYSIHIGPFCSIRSTSFNWSNSVYYCLLQSYSVHSVLFCPLWSYLVDSVQISPILSTSILFKLVRPI